jgi:hypothetical protein
MRKAIARVLVAALLAVALLGLLSGGAADAVVRCQIGPRYQLCVDVGSGRGILIGFSGTEGVIEVSVLRQPGYITGLQAINKNGLETAAIIACDGDTFILYLNRGAPGAGTVIDTMIPCPPS